MTAAQGIKECSIVAKQAKPKPGATGKGTMGGGNKPPLPRTPAKQIRVPVKK
jgi:hypothetical protein